MPLLEKLGVLNSIGTVVSGDTLPQRKPDPAPLLHAADALGVSARDCIYLGDAARDIEAGRAAGMRTIATSYGYISPSENVLAWEPDAIISHPRRIQSMIERMSTA